MDIQTLIAERIAALSLEDLAALGRPRVGQGEPKFLRTDGDLFIYQVRGQRIARAHADEARRLFGQMRRTEAGSKKIELEESLAKLFLKETAVGRKTVAANAVRRIAVQLKKDQQEKGLALPQ